LYSSEIEDFNDFFQQKRQKYSFLTSQQALFLCKSYGNEIDSLMDLGKENEEWLIPLNSDGENLAQVVFAVRYEMAKSLIDIVLRRTGIALLGNPGKEIIEKIAQIAAKELSWSVEKTNSEIEKLEQILAIPQ
jgi:glycerol-3-phosphate dehydrogenase